MVKKVAIIWANPYNSNMGVAALAYSALALVIDVLKENDQPFEVTILGSSKCTSDSIRIGENKYDFNNLNSLDYFKVKSFFKLILQHNKYNIFRTLSNDYILDLGEGDSFADIYGEARFNRIVNSKRLFNFFGKKQMLLPQTIGPFKSEKLEQKAIRAIMKFESVFARDKQSYTYTKERFEYKNVCESIDVAFYMPYERVDFEHDKINVGINVSGLLWNGGYTKKNQFGLKSDYQKLIRQIIEHFRNIENCKVYLVPHVVPNYEHVENDRTVSDELLNEYPDINVAPRFTNPIEAKSYISGLDFFTGARMHSTIAAFSSGVPVVPMAYSRKFNGLFKETLNYDFMGDLVNETNDVVFNSVIKGYENREKLSDHIQNSLKDIVKPRLEILKKDLAEFFNS